MSGLVDFSLQLGPPRDQGNRETCVAFAVGAAHEMARLRRREGPRADLGEELLYWRCKQIDGDTEGGTAPASAAQALIDPGQSAAGLWPYDGNRDDRSAAYQPPTTALDPVSLRHASLSETSPTAQNLGLDLWPHFFAPHGGELVVPALTDLLGEGHAVTVVGYDESAESLLIRNSWGAAWGAHGHARLPETTLEVASLGAWIVEDDIDP